MGAGASSSAATLGVGLAAGLVVDQVVSWAWDRWSDPRGVLARATAVRVDAIRRAVVEGTATAPGLRPRLESWAHERAAAPRRGPRPDRLRKGRAMTGRDCCAALVAIATVAGPLPSHAGLIGKAAREMAGRVVRRLGRGAAPAAVGPLAGRAEALAARHGDGAAVALLRHGRFAGPTLAAMGAPAAKALGVLSPRNARRLAMLAESGELARIGRTGEVLGVVGRSGDRAMDFVWRHKGALAVGTVLAAFLADPEPFLDGSRDLAGVAASAAVGTAAEVPGRVAAEAVRRLDWTLVAGPWVMLVTAALAMKACRDWRRAPDGERARR